MFYLLLKFKLYTLRINHFIIKHQITWYAYGHPAKWQLSSVTFSNFIVFQYSSLFWLGTQKLNTILIKQSLYINIKFD